MKIGAECSFEAVRSENLGLLYRQIPATDVRHLSPKATQIALDRNDLLQLIVACKIGKDGVTITLQDSRLALLSTIYNGLIISMTHIILPTLNAAKEWNVLAPALLACVSPEQVLVVDSQSTDGTVDLAIAAGFRVHTIARDEFNHGGTRQLAAEMLPDSEVLVYMTQDAILASPTAISQLVAALDDPSVAAAYGRQLPRSGAGAIESHARHFNYPPTSQIRDLGSRDQMGIKSIFISNSFAAYRRSSLMKAGGFPRDLIFGEDTITAAKLLIGGEKIAYVADALVYHSHSYTWVQDFRRYFDIGVLHRRQRQLLKEFGTTQGEGRRFVVSEIRYLLQAAPMYIPSALLRTGLKLLGYRLGGMEAVLPPALKTYLSMHERFWTKPAS